MAIVQETIDGQSTTEEEFEAPGTFKFCERCCESVLRSDFVAEHWDHHVEALLEDEKGDRGRSNDEGCSCSSDEIEDEPMEVGGRYSVELSYSMDFSFNIVARSESEAKQMAKDQVAFGNARDGFLVHTDISQFETYYEDDPEAEEYDLGW